MTHCYWVLLRPPTKVGQWGGGGGGSIYIYIYIYMGVYSCCLTNMCHVTHAKNRTQRNYVTYCSLPLPGQISRTRFKARCMSACTHDHTCKGERAIMGMHACTMSECTAMCICACKYARARACVCVCLCVLCMSACVRSSTMSCMSA